MENGRSAGGVGFLGLLCLLFIALKLCGVIGWSWWLVLLPLWGPLAVLFAAIGLCVVMGGVGLLLASLASALGRGQYRG